MNMDMNKVVRIENIRTLHKEGLPYRDIAKIIGCSLGTVCKYCGVGQLEKSRSIARLRYKPRPKTEASPRSPEMVKTAAKSRMLMCRYNLTQDQYEQLYSDQEGRCAICEEPYPLGGYRGLYVDHCHRLGHVRGLLCPTCNSALGQFKESEKILTRALDYLQQKPIVHETPNKGNL